MTLPLLAAQGALAAFGTYLGASSQKYITRAQNSVREAEAKAQNKVRDASNAFNLAVFEQRVQLQALGNRRITQDLGDALAAAATNYGRQKDLELRASFEDNLREAEEAGRQAAEAAASGVGGDAVDVISGTTRLREARAYEDAQRASAQGAFDYAAVRGNMVLQAITGLDTSNILADVDYGISVAQKQAEPNVGLQTFMSFMSNGGAQALAGYGTQLYNSWSKPTPALSGSDARFSFKRTDPGMRLGGI